MKRREAQEKRKSFAFGLYGESYRYGPFDFEPYRFELISSYRRTAFLVFLAEAAWLLWPVLSTTMYGSKAVFAWIAFGPAVVRLVLILRCIITEKYPHQIAPTIFFNVPEDEKNEQWLRWLGIHGQGKPHGLYSFISKWPHCVLVLLVCIVQIITRGRFHTDMFWLINSLLCLFYIYFTYSIGWNWVLFGCAKKREQCMLGNWA